MTRRNRTRLRVLNGGRAKSRPHKEAAMTTTVDVKQWPQETQELLGRLRQDFPDVAPRWATCTGSEKEPHERELYVGFLDPTICTTCAAEIPTELLDAPAKAAQ